MKAQGQLCVKMKDVAASGSNVVEEARNDRPIPSEATTGDCQDREPFMVDLMSGPNYPLARAFQMAGWRVHVVDILFGKEHDISELDNQEVIRKHLKESDFIWAALDCSDKSRIREIPRQHPDGPGPRLAVD